MSPSADIPSEGGAADKPCHNCRRRRLRCDRTVPHCDKCVSRGIECLGYGQLFLWTGAVASRGKLAGQKSSAALYPAAPSPRPRRKGSSSSAAAVVVAAPRVGLPPLPPPPPSAVSVAASTPSETDSDDRASVVDTDVVSSFGDDEAVLAASSGDAQLACITTAPSRYEYEHETSNHTPWVLVDPLFQDMKHSQRQYLAYCT